MNKQYLLNSQKGFGLMEVMIGLVFLSACLYLILISNDTADVALSQAQLTATRDRIISSIVDIISLPASIRNSALASNGGVPVNLALLSCVGGQSSTTGTCIGNTVTPFTLFSPLVRLAPDGTATNIQAITSPLGLKTANIRFDRFGVPCATTGAECPLLVYTSFVAKCGPAAVPIGTTVFTTADLKSTDTCFVADSIEAHYLVILDSNLLAENPELGLFTKGIEGTVALSVESITGNLPQ